MTNLKYLYISVYLPLTLVLGVGNVFRASFATKQNTQNISTSDYSIEAKKIDRIDALQKFFTKYNSPLIENAETFVIVADKYGLDYKLLPSIACMESTCAKFLIPGTYNPFGWGAGKIIFGSYDEAIERVGRGLSEIYLSRGLDTAQKIAPVYNPPSPYSWTNGVNFFISKIEEISLKS